MATQIYEVPESIKQMFYDAPVSYRIIDYRDNMEMDNNQSMSYFLEYIGFHPNDIIEDYGTQVVLKHDDFDYTICIDSGGLGDFYSHGFDVSIVNP